MSNDGSRQVDVGRVYIGENLKSINELTTEELQSKVVENECIITSLRSQLATANQENERQHGALRKIQATVFDQVEPAEWTPQDDNAIRDQLNLIQQREGQWCRAVAPDKLNMAQLKRLQFSKPLIAALNQVFNSPPGAGSSGSIKVVMNKFPLHVVLGALLADKIGAELYAKPFFFLDCRGHNGSGGVSNIDRMSQERLFHFYFKELYSGKDSHSAFRCDQQYANIEFSERQGSLRVESRASSTI